MFKYPWISAALLAIGLTSVTAEEQEAELRRVQSSTGGYEIWLAVPKSPARPACNLSTSPDALVVHLVGDELVLVFDDAYDMVGALEILRFPIIASYVVSEDGNIRTPFVIYGAQRTK
jgi:hypothetical protein